MRITDRDDHLTTDGVGRRIKPGRFAGICGIEFTFSIFEIPSRFGLAFMAIDNNTSQLKIVELVGVDAGIPRLTNVAVALEFVKIKKEPDLIGGDVEIPIFGNGIRAH